MAAPTPPLRLAGEFPPADFESWRALAAAVLRTSGYPEDTDPVAALSFVTYDGITVRPLYTAAEASPVAARPLAGTGWDVRQLHCDPDPAHTRRAADADLAGGATSLWLRLGAAGVAVDDLAAVLDGVDLGRVPIVLDAGAQTEPAAEALLALAEQRAVAGELRGSLGADPIGWRARTGAPADLDLLPRLAPLAADSSLAVATVDASVYSDAGASDADEIGIATAVAVAYLRTLIDAGVDLDAALAALEFRLAVSADQFAGIAKLRAARLVWSRVAQLSGATEQVANGGVVQRQHAVTAPVMMARRDPWTNLLRATLGCFAAAVGGAQAITVLPFDSAIGLPDELSRRLARNTQAILHDEASLGRVIDAAGGSWYVEARTQALAEKAWDSFTAIERAGGALASLDNGSIGQRIAASREARAADLATRRAPLTGVSEYALPDEPPLVRRPAAPQPTGGPLQPVRWAGEYERLRDAAEAANPRPAVFLAALGPLAAHSARLAFAATLFNAGGLRVVTGRGDAADLDAAFQSSGARVACLCSSDTGYADQGAHVTSALRTAGAVFVWIAGRPAGPFQEIAGVDDYLYTGCDALHVLRTTLELSGVNT